MKKFSVICAAALALTVPGIAQAASPNGPHTFTGTLEVRKSLPLWTACTVTAVVDVTGSVPRLQSATVTGGGVCGGITFTGLPSAPLNTTGLPLVVVPAPIGVNITFPAGTCSGSLAVVWGGNPVPPTPPNNPRTIAFADGTSNIPGSGGTPCRIRGVLTQTPGSLLLP